MTSSANRRSGDDDHDLLGSIGDRDVAVDRALAHERRFLRSWWIPVDWHARVPEQVLAERRAVDTVGGKGLRMAGVQDEQRFAGTQREVVRSRVDHAVSQRRHEVRCGQVAVDDDVAGPLSTDDRHGAVVTREPPLNVDRLPWTLLLVLAEA